MPPRMQNPAQILDGASPAIFQLIQAVKQVEVGGTTLELLHLRASQINGCSACVEGGVKSAKQAGETEERLHAVAAWRESPHFNDAERAALALAESVTRLADRPDPVPDEVWEAVAKHYDERQLAAIVLFIALANLFNRLNATTRQVPGSWG